MVMYVCLGMGGWVGGRNPGTVFCSGTRSGSFGEGYVRQR